MREAIFSTDGWGGHVNQDTLWDIPVSPEPAMKMEGGGKFFKFQLKTLLRLLRVHKKRYPVQT